MVNIRELTMEGGDADADKTAYEFLLTPKIMYGQSAAKSKVYLIPARRRYLE